MKVAAYIRTATNDMENYKQQLKDYCKRVGIEFIDVDQKGERNV